MSDASPEKSSWLKRFLGEEAASIQKELREARDVFAKAGKGVFRGALWVWRHPALRAIATVIWERTMRSLTALWQKARPHLMNLYSTFSSHPKTQKVAAWLQGKNTMARTAFSRCQVERAYCDALCRKSIKIGLGFAGAYLVLFFLGIFGLRPNWVPEWPLVLMVLCSVLCIGGAFYAQHWWKKKEGK